jgi:hypothetical protein
LVHRLNLFPGHWADLSHQLPAHPSVTYVLNLKSDHQNRADSHSYPLGNRSDIVIEHQTLQGLRTTVNLSQMDAAPLGLQMFLVLGSSGRERQKLGVLAKAR